MGVYQDRQYKVGTDDLRKYSRRIYTADADNLCPSVSAHWDFVPWVLCPYLDLLKVTGGTVNVNCLYTSNSASFPISRTSVNSLLMVIVSHDFHFLKK